MACVYGLLVALVALHGVAGQSRYKLCVDKDKYSSNECEVLRTLDSEVNCVTTVDSVDCTRKLKSGEVDFAVFTPNEIELASKSIDNDAFVIFELRETVNLQHRFRTVVVVNSTYSGGLQGLKGKNYCHPGFEDSDSWGDQALKFFESKVVEPLCDKERSVAEEELYSISRYFNKACRPWASADDLKKQFMATYPGLCSLCDNKDSCEYVLGQGKTHEAALDCLTKRDGDFAYVGYQESQIYFQDKGNGGQYKYLCVDGQVTQNISVPCYWYNQPWNAIVARKTIAQDLQNRMENWFINERSVVNWQTAFSEILKLKPSTNQMKKLSDYITQENAQISTTRQECNRDPIKWCTISTAEQNKCEKLKQASNILSIKPDISCVESKSDWECFKKLEKSEADIMGINTNLGFFTKKHFKFTSKFYQEPTDNTGLFISVPVVKADSGINGYSSLKTKNACFPEFGGLAYLSFLETLRNQSIQPEACPYKNTMGSFFGSTCTPGAVDDNHDPQKQNNDKDLCSLCPRTDSEDKCSADPNNNNNFYGDIGAMRCLLQNNGDVAFINANSLPDIRAAGIFNEFKEDQYRFLCKNGNLLPLNTVDVRECAIAEVLEGEVIGRNTLSNVQSFDINLALMKMNNNFGFNKRMFRMFDIFEDVEKLLFKSKTIGLLQGENANKYYITSYIKIVETSTDCSSGVLLRASGTTFVLVLVTAVFSLMFTRN